MQRMSSDPFCVCVCDAMLNCDSDVDANANAKSSVNKPIVAVKACSVFSVRDKR